MNSSNGVLIVLSSIIIYWCLFIYYAIDVGMSQGQAVIGVMFGFLIPLIILKWVHAQCDWDWS